MFLQCHYLFYLLPSIFNSSNEFIFFSVRFAEDAGNNKAEGIPEEDDDDNMPPRRAPLQPEEPVPVLLPAEEQHLLVQLLLLPTKQMMV